MNVPNVLTIIRILLIPIYLFFFYSELENNILYAGLVFILAGITDVMDGYIARKYDLTSDIGAVLDPAADKLMTFAILITFTSRGIIPPWILVAIGAKEVMMILGGSVLYLFKGKQVLPSNEFGKIATLSFYAATLSVVFKLPESISAMLFIVTVVLNVIAFINYLIIFLGMKNNTHNGVVDK